MDVTRRKLMIGMAGSVSIALAGCSVESGEFEGIEEDENTDDGDGGDDSSQAVELLSHQMVEPEDDKPVGTPIVEGEAKNVSGGELPDADIEVKFYDDSGRLLESSLDSISRWAAGETWRFEVQFPSVGDGVSDVADYTIRPRTSL